MSATMRLLSPAHVRDVSPLLVDHVAVAGGTDLLVQRRAGRVVDSAVDLTSLYDGPATVREDADGLRVSALAPLSAVSSGLGPHAPALRAAIRNFASTPIRNRATLGGNLATGSPAADTVPALLVHGARLDVVGPTGTRWVDLEDFLLGPRKVDLRAGEWIRSVHLPAPGAAVGGFRKIGGRASQTIAIVSLAWSWVMDDLGRRRSVRLAVGAVAPTVVRLQASERILEGSLATEPISEEIAEAVQREISPIDDLRGSATYRRACTAGLLTELLGTNLASRDRKRQF